MEYRENQLTYENYVSLRTAVGWNNYAVEQVAQSISNGFNIIAVKDKQTIAMGRLIGDGIYYLIVDVVVKPEYQKQGIGSHIVNLLLEYVDDNTPCGGRSSVQLIAEKGKEGFYLGKGFKLIPHEFCGSGLRKVINK